MKRTLVALVLLAGCGSESDLPENPPLAVPGQQVVQPPPAQPGQPAMPMVMPGQPTTFDPPLAIPGQAGPIQPPMPPNMPPGGMPPGGMPPGGMPPGGMPPGGVPPGGMQPQVPPGGAQPVTLAPGFQPAVMRLNGMAGGDTSAQQITGSADCSSGMIFAQPSQVMVLTAEFQYLRILAIGPPDPFLAIRGSDGSVRCNDDSLGGANPMIEGGFAPGTYQIWVGVYRQHTDPGAYVLGITQYPGEDHRALAQP